jgi:PAS domain S-box-containing protein
VNSPLAGVEQALRVAQVALSLTRSAPWSASSHEPDVMLLSPLALDLLGFDPSRGERLSVERDWRPCLTQADGQALNGVVQSLWSAQPLDAKPMEVAFGFRRPADGAVVRVLSRAHTFAQPDGSMGVIGAFQDITEQARVEKELRDGRERFELAIRGAGDGLWEFDHRSKATWFSPRFVEILGYQEGEFPATFDAWRERFHPEDAPAAFQAFGVHLATDAVYDMEYRVQHREGHYLWIRARAKSLRDHRGRPYRTSGTVSDLTVRKQAEEALRQAHDMAQETARVKSEFLANMSHEIRTPMNAIIGLSHLALKTVLDDRQRDYLRKIQQAGQHLLGIINDVLDFSKIEAGMMAVDRAEFSVESLMSNLASLVADKAAQKGLELVFQVDRDVPDVLLGDALRLGQILVNYTSNAIKFTNAGEVDVAVRVAQRREAALQLHFEVRDTGIGLTDEEMSRLFRSFQQADASTTRKYGGTGLGLAISRRLVELMGGEVGVHSEVGRGSTFWFTAWVGTTQQAEPARLDPARWSRVHLLVVDDHAGARRVLSSMLEDFGFKVDQADSGTAALQVLKANNGQAGGFDVVLLDWSMPGLDGLETARQIGGLGLAKSPRLALVTGHDREDVRQAALRAGLGEPLIKPVSPSSLYDRVATLLGASPLSTAPARTASQGAGLPLEALRGVRVLLAEDNLLNQRVAVDLLADVGVHVDLAGNGQQAVQMALSGGYDLVLMDMQMPVMDGLEATRALRALPELADLPVVAMTANAMAVDRERCLAAGMVDFVTKPVDPDVLFSALIRWALPRRQGEPSPVLKLPDVFSLSDDPAAAAPEIAGLDRAAGLRLVRGRTDRYLALLRDFVADQAQAAVAIREHLMRGQYEEAERRVHTLKGLAGHVGASDLAGAAAELERALRRPSAGPVPPALLDTLEHVLSKQVGAIADALPKATPEAPPASAVGVVDEAVLARVCHDMLVSLRNDDGQAELLAGQHEALLRAAFPVDFPDLFGAVRAFDSETALTLLARLLPARPAPPSADG